MGVRRLGGNSAGSASGNTTNDTYVPPNRERRLTFRFLTLPFRHQISVAEH